MTVKELERRLSDMESLTPYAANGSIKLRFVVGDIIVDVESYRDPAGKVVFDIYNPDNGYGWQLDLKGVLAAIKKQLK